MAVSGTPRIILPTGHRGTNRLNQLSDFASQLHHLSERIGFKISPRGWCYQLESFGLVTKAQFNVVENLINECRRLGFLPVDFVAEEDARAFSGVEIPETDTPAEYLARFLEAALESEDNYTPDWWEYEEYYLQMVVEKIDLKTLFEPVCRRYHIPIATSKGWSSILQRATYARRFREAEERGLTCVLLYCGDHDGLRISEFLRSNLEDIADVEWSDGTKGYDPSSLTILRFGLNFDFIEQHGLSWIPNLITGSGRNLASRRHPNYRMPYVQEYLRTIGIRKCEANALVVDPPGARALCESAIVRYLGDGARVRFEERRTDVRRALDRLDRRTKFRRTVTSVIKAARAESGKKKDADR